MFQPQYSTTQQVCSPTCAIKLSNRRKAEQKAALNEVRNEKVKEDRLNELTEQTRVAVNAYIRYRDQGKPCVSCGAKWHSGFHAGHAWSGAQHNMIRFDYDCVHGQCPYCNITLEGNYDAYRERLEKRIGTERFQRIKAQASIARRVPYKFSRHELKAIMTRARADLRQLKWERSQKGTA